MITISNAHLGVHIGVPCRRGRARGRAARPRARRRAKALGAWVGVTWVSCGGRAVPGCACEVEPRARAARGPRGHMDMPAARARRPPGAII